jgi:hypothetical protein
MASDSAYMMLKQTLDFMTLDLVSVSDVEPSWILCAMNGFAYMARLYSTRLDSVWLMCPQPENLDKNAQKFRNTNNFECLVTLWIMKLIKIFKIQRVPHGKQYMSITEASWLMMLKRIIAVHSENHTRQLNIMQDIRVQNRVIYISNHYALKRQASTTERTLSF